ncbi:MAG: Crp/Fnr family transcriptional regulator [Pseudomonadota bacterium]
MTPILEDLGTETRKHLEAMLVSRTYEAGEEIVSYQSVEDDLYFVQRGTVRVTIYAENGKMVDFRTMSEGAMFGEIAVIDDGPRSASVFATEACRIGRLSKDQFWQLVVDVPEFNAALLRHLSGLVRNLTNRVLEYSTLHGPRRLVLEIIRLAEDTGVDDGRVELDVFPTHHDLAARISSHREAVSRQLSELMKGGLLEKDGRRMVVKDLNALRAICTPTD